MSSKYCRAALPVIYEDDKQKFREKMNPVKNKVKRGDPLGGAALGRLAALLLSHLGAKIMLLRRALAASPNPPRATQHYFEAPP